MDVRTFCLGVLSLGDATGYEIKKQAEDGPFSHFYKAGFGSIYPALARLAADGAVPASVTPVQFGQEMREESAMWARVMPTMSMCPSATAQRAVARSGIRAAWKIGSLVPV